MAKEINYDSLKVNMELQVKYDFENDRVKYKKGEKLIIVSLISVDNKCNAAIVLKDDKEIKLAMYEINTWFKIVKSKNVFIDMAILHNDVELAIRNDKTIIVILETGFKGIATCDEESIFNEDTGYVIAYFKAKKKEINSRYKSSKKECIKSINEAQMALETLEKDNLIMEKRCDRSIKNAIEEVRIKPPVPGHYKED